MSKKKFRIILSGGGTGGHITPLVAIGHELRDRHGSSAQMLYIGSGNRLEKQLTAELKIQQRKIMAGKFRRYIGESAIDRLLDVKTLFFNIRDLFKFGFGLLQSIYHVWRFKPDVVFSKGGYVGLPVGLAAVLLKKPLVIHDSDTVPGLANRILSRWAHTIATGFPSEYYSYQLERTVFSGNIILPRYRSISKAEARAELGLSKASLPVVLVTGGGGGARGLNDVVLNQLGSLTKKYKVVHLCGIRDYPRVQKRLRDLSYTHDNYQLFDIVDSEMPALMAAADVVVSRAGASTLAEIVALHQIAILVPGPNLRDQSKNAAVLYKANAALLREQEQFEKDPAKLVQDLDKLVGSKELRATMQDNLMPFDRPDAAAVVVDAILEAKDA